MAHQLIEWLIENTSDPQLKLQSGGRLLALRQAMKWKIPDQAVLGDVEKRESYTPSSPVLQRLASPQLKLMNLNLKPNPRGVQILSATTNSGQAYIDECSLAGVPIPPTINLMDPNGTAGWKSEGFIPTASQFITGTPAELRSYKSSAPEGMCFALSGPAICLRFAARFGSAQLSQSAHEVFVVAFDAREALFAGFA